MNKFKLIEIEWNCYNGYCFSLLHIECWKYIDMDSALFAISFSRKYFLYISILFFNFKIYDNNESKYNS